MCWVSKATQQTMVRMHQETLEVATRGRGFTNLQHQVQAVLDGAGMQMGSCSLLVRHTSASLVIQENADPAVLRDLAAWMGELAPESRHWEHSDEGPDDMPAHARSALTRSSEVIPFSGGRLGLGTWQGIYLWEHRSSPHRRQVLVHVMGQ